MIKRCLGFVVGLVLATPMAQMGLAEDETKEENPKLETLAVHRTLARFEGANYRLCRGRTGLCPEKCGNSGEFANFSVVEYLHYQKLGKYGDPKQAKFAFQVSDFDRKPKGDSKLLKIVKQLAPGDVVLLEWKHLYGETKPGLISPVRPVSMLRKLTQEEAKKLRKDS